MPIVRLQDVTVAYQDAVVLQNISVEVQKGESFVVIGPSGQGKTTLLKTLCGLLNPEVGKVFIEQRELVTLSTKERREVLKKVGILFQKNALFDSLTCFENVAFPLREASELTDAEIRQRAHQYLEFVGLTQASSLYPDELSGGMQKRLGIARALALEPELIFYDDPTAGLDPITSRKIVDLIMSLQKKRNSTLVTVTNDMNRAYQMADRIAVVVDREVILTGSPLQTQNFRDLRVQQFIRGSLEGPLTAPQ